MSENCEWLHEKLESLTICRYPFDIKDLPKNGIYFFYEKGEHSAHDSSCDYNYFNTPHRIVRIGTHKEGNFRSRISEHFLLNPSKMNFDVEKPKPSDRSIFRKNIGRCLLNKRNDNYLKIWNMDFLGSKNKVSAHNRDIEKEKIIESEISKILHESFYFRFIELEGQDIRIGSKGLESRLIGSVSACNSCKASENWLGKYSPIPVIANGKLWLSQHLRSTTINETDKKLISSRL
jgi:hypothetical protein